MRHSLTQAPHQTGYGTYRRIQLETASSAELILQLYDGLVRNLRAAQLGMDAGDREQTHLVLVRAQDIVLELMTSLNPEVESDLPQQLAALYEYLHYRLVRANTAQDRAAVQEVLDHTLRLREAWAQAVSSLASGFDGAPDGTAGDRRG